MANRKQFKIILQPKTGPAHLDGLATWIDHQDEEPPVCNSSECQTNKNVEWRNGEWVCSKCRRVVSGGGW